MPAGCLGELDKLRIAPAANGGFTDAQQLGGLAWSEHV